MPSMWHDVERKENRQLIKDENVKLNQMKARELSLVFINFKMLKEGIR